MNSVDFEALVKGTFESLSKLSASKGLEYSGETDRLANFKEQGKLLNLSPIKILGVYLNKHLGSINKFMAGGIANSEPIEGRIDDAILYLILLKALISEEDSQMANPFSAAALIKNMERSGQLTRPTLDQQIKISEINRDKAMRDMAKKLTTDTQRQWKNPNE